MNKATMSLYTYKKKKIRVDGVLVQTYSFGEGKNVVFSFPSFPHSGLYYVTFLKYYDPKEVKFITFDLPGWIGFTQNVFKKRKFAMEEYTKIAKAVLDSYKVKRCSLIGYSFGGGLAVQLCAQMPEKFKRVVLVSPFVDGKIMHRDLKKILLKLCHILHFGAILKLYILNEFRQYRFYLSKHGVPADDLALYKKMVRRSNGRILMESLYNLFYSDWTQDLSVLEKRPVLIVSSIDEASWLRKQAEHVRKVLKHKKSMYIHGKHEDFILKPESNVVKQTLDFLLKRIPNYS